ncbi:hypothetical protein NC652_024365 [Populus alba x Populus x berolinensis]|nr:hypothetical protein NC652_024365 [Populus alba x Populus x berolinensis]
MGLPGAIIIKNNHRSQLYLKTVALEDVPGHGRVLFICNSWVYPSHRYKYNRRVQNHKPTVYFPARTALSPTLSISSPPMFKHLEPLRLYREEELLNLRGHGKCELKEWDRVYDYDYYNDLGNPDKGEEYATPYSWRNGRVSNIPEEEERVGEKHETDPRTEKRLPLLSWDYLCSK